MFPSGGTPVKVLATVAAFLTVATGVPRVRCVCPDGRAKLVCTGRAAAGCCCAGEPGTEHFCCLKGGATPPQVVTACGCHRTVVADALGYTAEGVGGSLESQAGGMNAWKLPPPVPEHRGGCALGDWRFLLPPPDLVVVLCHFTC